MADLEALPPKLGDIPQHSAFEVPTLGANAQSEHPSAPIQSIETDAAPVHSSEPAQPAATSLASAKETVVNNAAAAYNAVANHPTTQAAKDTVANGPVAEGIKNQTAKTNTDIQGLANKRTVPETATQNGQPLTHYHSFFYSLLSWEHPRATAISFATTIAFIFATRYLPLLRWFFKIAYVVLGVTAAAEVAGRLTINQGLASSFRPRRYYTIPRESLEAILEDVEQLINFFVIESQRIVFAENVSATIGTFVAAFLSYWLIKWLPLWGLSLIGASVVYLGPFIYLNNKELIDGHLDHASGLVSAQASQVRDLAGQHTGRATDSIKQYAGDYTSKAQNYLNSRRSPSPVAKTEPNFPAAPKHEPVSEIKQEPLLA